jgi:tripartite-type tricarboxylate transporter receptor subunit TctC
MQASFSRRGALRALGGSLLLPAFGAPARAEADWPQKPVRIVVPFAAGSATDAVVRVVAPHLTRLWGQGIVVDNRPGGSGIAATEAVVRADPDGYTLGLGCLPVNVTNPILKSDLTYDVDADTVPIVLLGTNRMYLVTHVSVPVLNLREFIEYARKNPGKLSYGSGGNATPQHLAMELLKIREKLDIVMVPYPRGNLMTDLLTGRIQTAMYVGPMQVVRNENLRVLGVAASERFHGEPEIPSFAEQGVADFESDGFFSFYGPKDLPASVVKRINLDANQALQDPELRQRLLEMQIVVRGGTPEELRDHIRRQQATARSIIEGAGIR